MYTYVIDEDYIFSLSGMKSFIEHCDKGLHIPVSVHCKAVSCYSTQCKFDVAIFYTKLHNPMLNIYTQHRVTISPIPVVLFKAV